MVRGHPVDVAALCGTGCPAGCARQCEEHTAWKRDVALQVSIDVGCDASTIRLGGTLDGATAVNLIGVVEELIEEGGRAFELRTEALCVPDGGVDALMILTGLLRGSGGRLAWGGATANRRFPGAT